MKELIEWKDGEASLALSSDHSIFMVSYAKG